MRKLLIIICLIGTVFAGKSQSISDYPVYPIPEKYRLKGAAGLPSRVDNSAKIFFPAIINQYGWSCNQASSIGYVFTYEINRLRNLAADSPDTRYTPGFVWNLLNSSNSGVGVSYFDSWEIVKAAGCPNEVDYPYYLVATGFWMSGYEKYYRAMHNRIAVNYSLPIGTPEGLNMFKQYLVDHFEDSPDGGVASVQIASGGMETRNWKDPDTNEQWPVLYTFGNDVGHALTLVGYNDSVRLDLNGDGKFTNNLDINNDGIVDQKDWEIGALEAVNSWGNYWKGGKVYILYSVAAREGNNGGIWNRSAHVVKAMKTYNPELTMRVVMRHEQRKKIRILAGVSTDLSATRPTETLSFPIFDHQGDNTPLLDHENSADPKRFEFGLDITPLISSLDPNVPVKFFLEVEETDPNGVATGQVDEFAVIHYLTAASEVVSDQKNVPIVNNGTTYLSLTTSLQFNKLNVEKPAVTNLVIGQPFYAQLSASGGQPPYRWELVKDYVEKASTTAPYLKIAGDTLSDFTHEKSFQRVTLPFEFPFYGNNYKSLYADIKGALYFDNEYIQYPYAVNQDVIFKVRKSIVPFGADIQVNEPGDVLVCSLSDTVATFQWNASVYIGHKVYPLEVGVRLYPDGRIVFQYGKRSVPDAQDYPWQAGICNGDMTMYKYASISEEQLRVEDYSLTYTPSDYPPNVVLTEDGILSGLASEEDHLWKIYVKVTDSYNQVKYSSIPISTISRDTAAITSTNFPNPFKRTTAISFKVSEEAPVHLEIFDFSGRKVRELVNETLLPGDFTYYWNARDASDCDVNPGIYIYRLRVGSQVAPSGKMVLMR